jgi:nucleotide-binding universal stress UspA family protein
MFETIVFATDLSFTANGVVSYVIETARVYRSKVYVMHVRTSEWGEMQQEEVERLKDRFGSIPHEVVIKDGDVKTTLLNFVLQENVDLMVVGTHGRTGLGRVLLGSVAEAIFREASCPVLTVGPRILKDETRTPKISEILYATDLTSVSAAARRYAVSMAQENKSRLIILNVQLKSEAGGLVKSQDHVTFTLRRLQELVPKGTELWCEPYCMVEEGDAAEKILEVAAKYGASTIVLGIRPHSIGLATHLVRPTAHRVVVGASCPVLTVRGWGRHVHENAIAKGNLQKATGSPGLCPA